MVYGWQTVTTITFRIRYAKVTCFNHKYTQKSISEGTKNEKYPQDQVGVWTQTIWDKFVICVAFKFACLWVVCMEGEGRVRSTHPLSVFKAKGEENEERQQKKQKVPLSWQPRSVQQTCFRGACSGGILGENQSRIHPSTLHRASVANLHWGALGQEVCATESLRQHSSSASPFLLQTHTHTRTRTQADWEKRQAGFPQGRAESYTMFSWYNMMKVNWNTLCWTATEGTSAMWWSFLSMKAFLCVGGWVGVFEPYNINRKNCQYCATVNIYRFAD